MNRIGRIGILIVDHHPVVREGLRAVLERQQDMVVLGEAASGLEALDEFRRRRPDVTLMDLRLPEISGIQAIEAIGKEFPGSRILVLTTFDGDEEIYQAFRAGARGFLLKSVPIPELLDAIRTVHAGRRKIPPPVAARLAERVPGCELTTREMEVVRLIVDGKSNKDIAAALALTEGTVKSYVHQILGKMGVADRTEAATTAIRRGMVYLE